MYTKLCFYIYCIMERHHVIPISIWGHDKQYNIMNLDNNTHIQLHRTLDIATHIYSKMQRKAKEKTNHKLVWWPDEIEIWADMQRLFFDRFSHLDRTLQKKHIENMLWQFNNHKTIYKNMTGSDFDNPSIVSIDNYKTFNNIFEEKNACQKETSRVIIECLKKNLSL